MTDEEKRVQTQTADKVESTANDTVEKVQSKLDYTNPYDGQIKDLYDKISNRDSFEFSYNPSSDEMYNAYVDRYMSLGKQAMRDTMGQAAALTGGYGSSYAQGVGQQAYDTYLQGANDKLREFADRGYELAYRQYADEGDRLNQQYAMLGDMADEDYMRYQDRISRQNEAYDRMAALITTAGYNPTDEELAQSGMTREAAEMLQYQWAATYPQLAYNQGVITPEQFNQITGGWPIGYSAGTGGGYGGGYWGGGSNGGSIGGSIDDSNNEEVGSIYKGYAETGWARPVVPTIYPDEEINRRK